jgi:hypothetical protein
MSVNDRGKRKREVKASERIAGGKILWPLGIGTGIS